MHLDLDVVVDVDVHVDVDDQLSYAIDTNRMCSVARQVRDSRRN